MPKNFYISDLHLGHGNVIRFDGRPFGDVAEMEQALISNWNSRVGRDDTVYILGDFIWGKEPEWRRLVPLFTGNKVLIRGNHDLKSMSREVRNLFQDVKDYKEITDNGRHVILCHYPILFYKAAYNPLCYMLCGHVHTTRENGFLNQWRQELRLTKSASGDNQGNIYNVGCMLPYMGYTPRSLDEIVTGANQTAL